MDLITKSLIRKLGLSGAYCIALKIEVVQSFIVFTLALVLQIWFCGFQAWSEQCYCTTMFNLSIFSIPFVLIYFPGCVTTKSSWNYLVVLVPKNESMQSVGHVHFNDLFLFLFLVVAIHLFVYYVIRKSNMYDLAIIIFSMKYDDLWLSSIRSLLA